MCYVEYQRKIVNIFSLVSSLCRPEHLDLTRRVATMGSRAPPAAKLIKINHTTKATTRKEKMCETLHKRIFADRAELTCPHHPTSTPPLLTVWSHPDLGRICLCQASEEDEQEKKEKRNEKNCYCKQSLMYWTWTVITMDKWPFASHQLILRSVSPRSALIQLSLAPPAVQE